MDKYSVNKTRLLVEIPLYSNKTTEYCSSKVIELSNLRTTTLREPTEVFNAKSEDTKQFIDSDENYLLIWHIKEMISNKYNIPVRLLNKDYFIEILIRSLIFA